MEHNLTSTEGDTKIRSIRVEVVLEIRVGSVYNYLSKVE